MATPVIEALASNNQNTQLEGVQNLKNLFRPPDKIFSKLKLQSLLQGARLSIENKTPGNDILHSYASSLVSFLGNNATLDTEIFHQVEHLLGELKNDYVDDLILKLWSKLESTSTRYPDGILEVSNPTIERIILDWVFNENHMEVLSKLSSDSPKLFQMITSILYEVLVKTRGHVRIFEVTSSFVVMVKQECVYQGKCFLELYPKSVHRLVSFMRFPPEVWLKGKGNVKDVMELLLEVFLENRRTGLILLSHFPKWVHVFRIYLKNS